MHTTNEAIDQDNKQFEYGKQKYFSAQNTNLNSAESSGFKKNSGVATAEFGNNDKHNIQTRLNDEEENVDYLEMFNQYQNQKQKLILQKPGDSNFRAQNQVQYYNYPQNQNQQGINQNKILETKINYQTQEQKVTSDQGYKNSQAFEQSYRNSMKSWQAQQEGKPPVVLNPIKQKKMGKYGAYRPGSATVAGQANKFITNQASRKRYEKLNQLEQVQYSYQQSQAVINNKQINNFMAAPQYVPQTKPNIVFNQVQQTSLMKPPISSLGQRKRTRPQSAARNQLQPSKNLQSVTNFTYQKAKQNLFQRAFIPESMKNTDKEKLYEEKINLQKQVNDMMVENLQLKTQVQIQTAHIKKKDDIIQQVMKQIFHPPSNVQNGESEFIQDFQNRELNHKQAVLVQKLKSVNTQQKVLKQNGGLQANKDSQISSLKLKIKEMNDQLISKDKELNDLKQTLKFTKIKEYEIELSLNVQESQRLRNLLEREMQKPKVDPMFVQGLRQQIVQQQSIIQNFQLNAKLQSENFDKLNKKLAEQIKRNLKIKESRKKIFETKQRLEKKLLIVNTKLMHFEQNNNMRNINTNSQQRQQQFQSQTGMNSNDNDQKQQYNQLLRSFQDKYDEQNQIIEKLCIKMQENGIEINETDLIPNEDLLEKLQINEEEMQDQDFAIRRPSLMDLIVTMVGGQQKHLKNDDSRNNQFIQKTKEMINANFEDFSSLKESLRKEFEISKMDDFNVKFVNQDGSQIQLSDMKWEQLKIQNQMQQQNGLNNKIQLAIELLGQDQIIEEPSNYDEEIFDQEGEVIVQKGKNEVKQKEYKNPITFEEVMPYFEELKLILQIKKVKKIDCLKFILHGIREQKNNQKVKNITIKILADQLKNQIAFYHTDASLKIAEYLIEVPNEQGKIEIMGDYDVQSLNKQQQTHENIVSIKRKDLQKKLLLNIKDYQIYNGLAITSLLGRVQSIFENYLDDLEEELKDQDYDDQNIVSQEDLFKSMKIVGMFPDSFDDDIKDFLLFLAMRHSKSLQEINYKHLINSLKEGYSFIDDEKSQWELENSYEPSSDEGELESDRIIPPIQQNQSYEDGLELQEQLQRENLSFNQIIKENLNAQDIEQNELLEKVDQVLMLIVNRLPKKQKIRTLTHLMMPYLSEVYDSEQQKQFLIISQNAFIQFLMGQEQNQLGLKIEDGHIISLLQLLVQDIDDQQDFQDINGKQNNKFILYDEFIELVKTYMKKELIIQQSKSLGINYDILSKESVEFLFQIRSNLMNDNNQNINEDSADEDDQNIQQKFQIQKSIPQQIRQLFKSVIQKKNIALNKKDKKNKQSSQQIEVMDFDQMTEILSLRLGIRVPSIRSQEEIKFLMCLDFKYLEMVMLIKFDKIMQDLDYISIDLLRQVQDQETEQSRQMAISELRRLREKQLSHLKDLQAQKSTANVLNYNQNNQAQIQNEKAQTQAEIQGVSLSSKQEKKRKRPDDKKQNFQKKQVSSITNQEIQGQNGLQNEISDKAYSQKNQNQIIGKSNYDQSYSNGSAKISGGLINNQSGNVMISGSIQVKERYGQTKNKFQEQKLEEEIDDIYDEVQEESDRVTNERKKKSQTELEVKQNKISRINDFQNQQVIDNDFDNIDVNLERDVHNSRKLKQNKELVQRQVSKTPSEDEEDYLQDDIPVDYDDEENEDGIISDNYENFEDKIKTQNQRITDQSIQFLNSTKNNKNIQKMVENEQEIQKTDSQEYIRQSFSQKSVEAKNQNDEHLISMDHSDDIEDSSPIPQINQANKSIIPKQQSSKSDFQEIEKSKSSSQIQNEESNDQSFDENQSKSEQQVYQNEIEGAQIKVDNFEEGINQERQIENQTNGYELEQEDEDYEMDEEEEQEMQQNQSSDKSEKYIDEYEESNDQERQLMNNQSEKNLNSKKSSNYEQSVKQESIIQSQHSQHSIQKSSKRSYIQQSSRKELTRQSNQKIDPNILINLKNQNEEDLIENEKKSIAQKSSLQSNSVTIKAQIQLPIIQNRSIQQYEQFEDIEQLEMDEEQEIEMPQGSQEIQQQEQFVDEDEPSYNSSSQFSRPLQSERVQFYQNDQQIELKTPSVQQSQKQIYDKEKSQQELEEEENNIEEIEQEMDFQNEEIPDDDIDAEPDIKLVRDNNEFKDDNSEASRQKIAEIRKQLEGDFSDEYVDNEFLDGDEDNEAIENYNQIDIKQEKVLTQSQKELVFNKEQHISHTNLKSSQISNQSSRRSIQGKQRSIGFKESPI